MKNIYLRWLLSPFLIFFLTTQLLSQGSTTANLSGLCIDQTTGEALIGANVLATHIPSGSVYGTVTRIDGHYSIPNARVGGPYSVTVSYIGYKTTEQNDIYLSLGQTYKQDFRVAEEAIEIASVEVIGTKSVSSEKTGAETTVSEEMINSLPSLSRNIADFAQLNPAVSLRGDDVLSIGGSNNRYNSIYIDGAVNNDVFGLAASGTNGGQTGVSPISNDAIEQFQIVVAPFDVRQGGFSGGGINTVTRSGTNSFEGSAYFFHRNEGLAGKTPISDEDLGENTREKLADFSANTYGFRLGGPIMKNKLFFFLNGEIQRDKTPQPFNFDDYEGLASEADLQALTDKLSTDYGYDAGGYLDNTRETNSDKIFARIDYNISPKHKLMLRHQYTRGESISANRSADDVINFYNNGVNFPSTTNSTALELNSVINNQMSNKLIIGFTKVKDDRDPLGENFPYVTIGDGPADINFGSERFSTGNALDQSVYTLTNNFTMYKGKHELTFGTHNELYSIYNLFIRENYGSYRFSDLETFMSGGTAFRYDRSYSLVDDVTGDGSAAAADFNAAQLGFYVQDEFQVNQSLRITGGLRVDIPMFLTDPNVNNDFNEKTIPLIEAEWGEGILEGAAAGKMPGTQLLISPRIGFNYDLTGDRSMVLRGGTGIFTSRIPFVWPGGMFTNNGLSVGGIRESDVEFNPQWDAQGPELPATVEPSGQMDLFVEDFKYPQVWKSSIALDAQLPAGILGTFEFVYGKNLNNIINYNYNTKQSEGTLDGVDNRPYFSLDDVDDTYSRIMLVDNTNEGYNYTLTAQLSKNFNNGLGASVSYTYGSSKGINDGTSSQNSSNWRFVENINGRNNLDLSYSDFDMGSRFLGVVSYSKDWFQFGGTSISMILNAESGRRFSYVYSNSGNMTGQDFSDSNLLFVPTTADDISLVDITDFDDDGNEFVETSAAEQWEALNTFITNDDYLNSRRGQYAERNGSRLPFTTILDMKLAQKFFVEAGGRKHQLEFTFAIFNLTNLINKDWGRRYFVSNDQYRILSFDGFAENTKKPQFQYFGDADSEVENIDDSGLRSSRWQGQIGLRYTF